AEKTHAKEELLLYRDQLVSILMNRFPYANGHLLVAPTRHVADLTELTDAENAAIMRIIQKSVTILRAHMMPNGFNIGLNLGETAGAGIAAHLHWHIVPRWDGDHNFMTVLADVRTIPEHINNTFDRLLPDFQAIDQQTRQA
ncbi:MAG: HIT domain-containing protein, partial [Desulfobulbaceae bacterium]|nr:HIT domain-containing protein [Desulfobulbaceae bacterium]